MKFKVGDKVRVRRDLSTSIGGVVNEMLQYKNQEMTIEEIKADTYRLVEDKFKYCWTDAMLNAIRKSNKIKDGDIVKAIGGTTPTVIGHIGFYHKGYIEFFEYIGGHSASGRGVDGYCWYVDDKDLEKVEFDKVNVYDFINNYIMTFSDSQDWFKNNKIEPLFAKVYGNNYEEIKKLLEENNECELVYKVVEETNILILKKDKYWFRVYEEAIKVPNVESNTELTKQLMKSIDDLGKKIEERSPFQDAMTQAIIDKGKELAVEDLKQDLKQELNDFIEKTYGVLPKKIVIENNDTRREVTGIFHKDFDRICKIVSSNTPLMLVGGAGAGKNHTLEQVSEALGLTFYTTNAVNQDYKLTGFIDANGKYHETEFYKAFTNGGMFFLDEIDASCPEALIILNGAIANKYFDFPTGRVNAHKDFRVVCAGNTYGTGADMVYVGRNVLDGATLDRFVVLNFDYDEDVEKALAYDNDLFNFIRDLRNAVNDSGLRYIVSMRALINATKLLEIGIDKKTILKTTIIKNMQVDDLNTVIKKISHKNEWYNELVKMSDIND